jgi:hypothetical protein
MRVPALVALALFLGSIVCVVALNERRVESSNGKTNWPELVGRKLRDAVVVIKQELPRGALVQVLPQGAMVTMDYRLDRVRVFVSEDDRVSAPPMIG